MLALVSCLPLRQMSSLFGCSCAFWGVPLADCLDHRCPQPPGREADPALSDLAHPPQLKFVHNRTPQATGPGSAGPAGPGAALPGGAAAGAHPAGAAGNGAGPMVLGQGKDGQKEGGDMRKQLLGRRMDQMCQVGGLLSGS